MAKDAEKVEMAEGKLGKVVAIRLKPGADVLKGLEQAAANAGIQNGVILTGMGSLDGARYCNPVELKDSPSGYGYDKPLELKGPIELTSMSGIICHDDEGVTNLHVHICLTDRYGTGHGGHLVEGTKVLLTTDVVMAEITGGVIMGRKYDPELGVPIFNPVQADE